MYSGGKKKREMWVASGGDGICMRWQFFLTCVLLLLRFFGVLTRIIARIIDRLFWHFNPILHLWMNNKGFLYFYRFGSKIDVLNSAKLKEWRTILRLAKIPMMIQVVHEPQDHRRWMRNLMTEETEITILMLKVSRKKRFQIWWIQAPWIIKWTKKVKIPELSRQISISKSQFQSASEARNFKYVFWRENCYFLKSTKVQISVPKMYFSKQTSLKLVSSWDREKRWLKLTLNHFLNHVWNTFESLRISLNPFESLWTSLNIFESLWISLNHVKTIFE